MSDQNKAGRCKASIFSASLENKKKLWLGNLGWDILKSFLLELEMTYPRF
jgi:hypothetical protein